MASLIIKCIAKCIENKHLIVAKIVVEVMHHHFFCALPRLTNIYVYDAFFLCTFYSM